MAFRRLQRLVSDGPDHNPRRRANAKAAPRCGSTRRGSGAHEGALPPSVLPSTPLLSSWRHEDEGTALTAKLKREKGVLQTYEKRQTWARGDRRRPNPMAFRRLQRLVSEAPNRRARRQRNAQPAKRRGSTHRDRAANEPRKLPPFRSAANASTTARGRGSANGRVSSAQSVRGSSFTIAKTAVRSNNFSV